MMLSTNNKIDALLITNLYIYVFIKKSNWSF